MPSIVLNGGAAGAKASVSAAGAVSATLETIAGVRAVTWSVAGTDETTTAGSFTLTQSGSIGQNCSLTAGGAGTAGILKATCAMRDGTYETTTAKWYVPTTVRGLEVIAYAEEGESGASGWAEPVNEMCRAADTSAFADGQTIASVASVFQTAQTSYQTGPALVADLTGVASVTFEAVLEATSGMTARVRLYNQDTASAVTDSALTTTSTTPTRVSTTLTVPADLPASLQTYLVQLQISAGSPGDADQVVCRWAALRA